MENYKYTYITRDNNLTYIGLNELLDPDCNDLGDTYEDYLAGKWVLLNEDQVKFKRDHPEATVEEVINMVIEEKAPITLEKAKEDKIKEIKKYDNSPSVNTCLINGVSCWIDADARARLMCSLISASNRGDEIITFPLLGTSFTLPTKTAFELLDQLNGDADKRANVTAEHISDVQSLSTVGEVESYDYKVGYPEFLSFNI